MVHQYLLKYTFIKITSSRLRVKYELHGQSNKITKMTDIFKIITIHTTTH